MVKVVEGGKGQQALEECTEGMLLDTRTTP
jgi:hypothetical protein